MTTGWPPGLLQDDSRELSRWFASRIDARRVVRQVCAEIERERMTAEPKLPPLPARFTFSNACKNEFEVYGLQCFEAGRQQGMTQERALHGLAASSREIEAGHQWQDIETAPKDGTVVILWSDADARFDNNGNGGRWLGCFAGGVWVSTVPVLDEWNDGGGNLMLNPTHWQPFPSPPKA